jgi:hypothetical protein
MLAKVPERPARCAYRRVCRRFSGIAWSVTSNSIARKKGLALGSETMRRCENDARETTRRIQDGLIGEVAACEVLGSGGGLWGSWIIPAIRSTKA